MRSKFEEKKTKRRKKVEMGHKLTVPSLTSGEGRRFHLFYQMIRFMHLNRSIFLHSLGSSWQSVAETQYSFSSVFLTLFLSPNEEGAFG